LLKAQHTEHKLFAPFNRLFERFTRSYTSTVGLTLKHGVISGIIFALVIASTVAFFRIIPGSFVPAEDQGYLISALMLPDGATLKRTQKTGEDMRQMVAKDPAVKHTFVVSGFDLIGGGNKPNAGTIFIPLKDWSEREAKAQDLAGKFMGMGMMQGDGMALVFNPPPIMGLGTAGGFEVYVQNRIDGDAKKLNEVTQSFIAALQTHPEFTRISTFFRPTVPQLFVEVDEAKALALGIPLASIYETLQSTMGALYVNDFNKAGRVYRVQLQAEASYRMKPDDLGKVYVRSSTSNAMIPLSAISKVKNVVGPEQVERFNGFVAAKVMGDSKPGISSGDAIKIVEEVAAATLPSRLRNRLDRSGFPGKAQCRLVLVGLRLRHHHGLPDPGRPVRKMVAAGRRRHGRALRPDGGADRRLAARHAERHLLPDRPRRADRAGLEKRHPDRRIRRPEIRRRDERQ
jgi:multidrug efflux pump subunit AcrB